MTGLISPEEAETLALEITWLLKTGAHNDPPNQVRRMNYLATDEQVEEIILLSRLTDMHIVRAVHAVIPDFNEWDMSQTLDLSARIRLRLNKYKIIQDELDNNNKATHSSHTQQPEYANAEEG